MVDKARPLKIENDTDGTELNMIPTEIDPTEDYISTKGIALENSDNHLIDLIDDEVTFTDPVNGSVKVSDLAPHFGTEYYYAESLAESSTTSDIFQNKLNITTGIVSGGDYIIFVNLGLRSSGNNKVVEAQIDLDNGTILQTTQTTGSEYGQKGLIGRIVTLSPGGIHTLDVDYRRVDNGTTAYIRNVIAAMFKVSQ